MIIDRIFKLVLYISNKEQRGDIPPAQFNILAEMAQLEYISKRVPKNLINERGMPQLGYEASWRIHEDLRPMVYGPEVIQIQSSGNFIYPYGYMYPDAVHKNDFSPITRITADQYPRVKHSVIHPPTAAKPIMIMRNPYGFIDPYSIGSFSMSYLKNPPIPVWGFGFVGDSDRPVFDANTSVDFTVHPLALNELAMIILSHVGINLSEAQVAQYAMVKNNEGV